MQPAVPPEGRLEVGSLAPALGVLASAVPLLLLAPIELIGYDAFWHVFIARQDRWLNLWEQIGNNAHPPLFYLCLRAAIAVFGTNAVTYRLVSVAASLAATWLVGRIAWRATGRPWLSAAAAFSFGTSLTTVTIGLDVRPYALATFFMLWACLALSDLVARGLDSPNHRPRVIFAVMTSLALMTHYGAALFLASSGAACLLLVVVDPEHRRGLARAGLQWRANLLTFAVPSGVFAVEYVVHVAAWGRRGLNHTTAFLFNPVRESAPAFLWRNTQAFFELLLPPFDYRPFATTLVARGPALSDGMVGVLVAASLAGILWLVRRPAPAGRAGFAVRRLPPALLALMAGVLVVLALGGRYPYGGTLRHQYFLFPFVIVVLAQLVSELAGMAGHRAARTAVGLFALAGVLNVANWATQFQPTRGYLWQAQIDRFRNAFPSAEAVYVDQFNLINLFTHHHDAQWRFIRSLPGNGAVDVWRVDGPGGRAFYVCRDRAQWQLNLANRATYQRIAGCLEATGTPRVVVFRPQQQGIRATWPLDRTEALLAEGAAAAGLVAEKLVLNGEDVTVSLSRGDTVKSPR